MIRSVETRAFPASLIAEVGAIVPMLSDCQQYPPSETFRVFVRSESIDIPYRVYYRESHILECAERQGIQGSIALCLGTRHHNGFLREKCAERLITVEEPWVVPFVMQLVGEYVLQILQLIERALPDLNAALYGDFLNANAAHYATIRRRVTSYWDVYYRSQYPKWEEYSGYRVLAEFNRLASTLSYCSSGLPLAAVEVKR